MNMGIICLICAPAKGRPERIVNAVKHNTGLKRKIKPVVMAIQRDLALFMFLYTGRGRKKALYGRLIGAAAFNLWI
ncbi:MAG: hypothetical protein OXC66_07950 [Roseovarius sp.]|nr:hypothetical protein [Roseovarius sp.]